MKRFREKWVATANWGGTRKETRCWLSSTLSQDDDGNGDGDDNGVSSTLSRDDDGNGDGDDDDDIGNIVSR